MRTFALMAFLTAATLHAQSNVPSALIRALDAECTNVTGVLSNRIRSAPRIVDWTSIVPPTNGIPLAQTETLGNRIVRTRVNTYVGPAGSGWFMDFEAQVDGNVSNVVRRSNSGTGPYRDLFRHGWILSSPGLRVNTNGVP